MQKELSDKSYKDFSTYVKKKLGIVLGDNKQYLVRSRLSIAMREFGANDINDFITSVMRGGNSQMSERALFAMTTNETFWFRDKYPFHILEYKLLPEIRQHKDSIRIWSAACSHGQEPYSIAMCIDQYNRRNPGKAFKRVEIMATDISKPVLAKAEAGHYDDLSVSRGLEAAALNQYFTQISERNWQIKSDLRDKVTFKQLNLLDSFSHMGKFDVVFCRNVLIYFEEREKASILQKISAQLPPGGALFLGAAESNQGAESFYKLNKQPQGLYYSRV